MPSDRARICARRGCETEFTPRAPHHRFCSDACRKRNHEDEEGRRQARFAHLWLNSERGMEAALAAYRDAKRQGTVDEIIEEMS